LPAYPAAHAAGYMMPPHFGGSKNQRRCQQKWDDPFAYSSPTFHRASLVLPECVEGARTRYNTRCRALEIPSQGLDMTTDCRHI
jgi:hypothetical protein